MDFTEGILLYLSLNKKNEQLIGWSNLPFFCSRLSLQAASIVVPDFLA